MSQFQLEQTSVIKTAPPGGRQLEFPKNEPIDIASSNLQDLTKINTLDAYYQTNMPVQSYHRVYENYPASQIITQTGAHGLYYNPILTNTNFSQDWGRQMDTNNYSQGYSRSSSSQQYTQQITENERIVYKNSVDMPSPVDSGIGGDISLMANPKEEFFTGADGSSMLERSSERTLSHRDSPLVIPKLWVLLDFWILQ